MANFHPSDNYLVEYAAGTLDWGLSIMVSAHLSICPDCRHKLRTLNCVGGAMVKSSELSKVDDHSFSKVMARIKAIDSNAIQDLSSTPKVNITHKDQNSGSQSPTDNLYSKSITQDIPSVIQKLLPRNKKLKWKRVSRSLYESQLKTHQDKYKICFHKIKRGGKVIEHDHNGIEVTLVLKGSFSDEDATYAPGDFVIRSPGETHRPIATQNEDCLCLSLTDSPVKVSGAIGKMINPFLSFHPG